jgi:hypothetical protein
MRRKHIERRLEDHLALLGLDAGRRAGGLVMSGSRDAIGRNSLDQSLDRFSVAWRKS